MEHIKIIPGNKGCFSQEINGDKAVLKLAFLKFLRTLLSFFS